MRLMLGDRLGGVIFDIQQYRSFKRAGVPLPDHGNPVRQKWIEYCSEFLGIIEAMDEKELREGSNPRIGPKCCNPQHDHNVMGPKWWKVDTCYEYERCENTDHDRCGQRKTDCTECFPPEQASLTSSLANLNEIPVLNTDVHMETLHDDREPRMAATICTCETPLCNADNHFPKACYSCGGIVVKP